MKKNIYDILNDVTIDLNEYDQEDFNDLEITKIKNKFKKSTYPKKNNYKRFSLTASVFLLVFSLFTTNIGSIVWAHTNMIVYDIKTYLGLEGNLDEYKTVVNEAQTLNGITVKLNEVILDDNQLILSTTYKSNKKLDEMGIIFTTNIYVNGRNICDGASGSSEKIDEFTEVEVTYNDLIDTLKGDLDIKLVFSDPLINGKTIKGDWIFAFKTNGDELALDTKKVLLNNTFELENNQKIILEKYTSNNLGQKIYFSKDPKNTDYDMILKGYDDLGNKVEFIYWRARDNKGIFKINTLDRNLSKKAKALYLTLYAVEFPEGNGRLSNDFKKVGEEFKIDLTKLSN